MRAHDHGPLRRVASFGDIDERIEMQRYIVRPPHAHELERLCNGIDQVRFVTIDDFQRQPNAHALRFCSEGSKRLGRRIRLAPFAACDALPSGPYSTPPTCVEPMSRPSRSECRCPSSPRARVCVEARSPRLRRTPFASAIRAGHLAGIACTHATGGRNRARRLSGPVSASQCDASGVRGSPFSQANCKRRSALVSSRGIREPPRNGKGVT
jgi:hypothetical protein